MHEMIMKPLSEADKEDLVIDHGESGAAAEEGSGAVQGIGSPGRLDEHLAAASSRTGGLDLPMRLQLKVKDDASASSPGSRASSGAGSGSLGNGSSRRPPMLSIIEVVQPPDPRDPMTIDVELEGAEIVYLKRFVDEFLYWQKWTLNLAIKFKVRNREDSKGERLYMDLPIAKIFESGRLPPGSDKFDELHVGIRSVRVRMPRRSSASEEMIVTVGKANVVNEILARPPASKFSEYAHGYPFLERVKADLTVAPDGKVSARFNDSSHLDHNAPASSEPPVQFLSFIVTGGENLCVSYNPGSGPGADIAAFAAAREAAGRPLPPSLVTLPSDLQAAALSTHPGAFGVRQTLDVGNDYAGHDTGHARMFEADKFSVRFDDIFKREDRPESMLQMHTWVAFTGCKGCIPQHGRFLALVVCVEERSDGRAHLLLPWSLALRCSAVQGQLPFPLLCSALLCSTLLHSTPLYSSLPHPTLRCSVSSSWD